MCNDETIQRTLIKKEVKTQEMEQLEQILLVNIL